MKVEHRKIIPLVGYCYETRHKHVELVSQNSKAALCFEYMEGCSLDKHISDELCGFDWCTRCQIIKGICEGLNSLLWGGMIMLIIWTRTKILLGENMMPSPNLHIQTMKGTPYGMLERLTAPAWQLFG